MSKLTRIDREKLRGTYQRNELIRALFYSGARQADLGRRFGLPRQRVFQIIEHAPNTDEKHQGQKLGGLKRKVVAFLKEFFLG